MKNAFLAVAFATLLFGNGSALAVDKWWDINGTTADSGQAAAAGTWSTTVLNWNTDSTGGAGGAFSGWTGGVADRAFFSAGGDATSAFTMNVTSALTAGSVFVEEGIITKSGAALTVNQIDIASGASFVYNASGGLVPTGTLPAVTLHGTGATFGYTAGGGGGTFLNTGFRIVLDGGGTLTDSVGSPNIYGGVISGTGNLVKTGAGVLALTNTSTYTGSTIVNQGTIRLRTGTPQIPNTDLVVNGTGGFDAATFTQTVQSLSGTGNLPFSGAGTLNITGTASTTFSGVWSGSGRINVNKSGGTGTLTIDGVNTGTGRFTVTNGTVTVNPTKSLGGSVMDLEVNGGTLNLNNAAQSVEGLAGTGGTINLASGHMLTVDPVAAGTPINNVYSGVIAGDGGITKINVISGATVRTETLAGNNTYNGNTFVRGGILSVQHANALGSTTGYTEVSQVGAVAAELLFTTAAGSVTTFEPLRISGAGATNNGAIAVTNAATPTISGPVTLIGNSTLTVSGSASVLYNNANAITSLANQNLTLQGGSGTAPLGIGTISGEIALGTGSLTKLQGGTWVLSNAAGNTYSGGTFVGNSSTAGGVLSVTNTSGSGTGSGNITIGNAANTGTLNVGNGGAGGSVSGNIAFANTSNTSVLNFNRTTDDTYGGNITGANGTVNKVGSGKLVVTGTNSYGGATNVNGGILQVDGNHSGTGAVTVNTGGTLAGTGSLAGAVTVNTGGTVSPGASIDSFAVGALTFNTGSTLNVEINSDLSFSVGADLLDANGDLNIAATGALLAIVDAGSTVLTSVKYTLISYAGSWNGNSFDSYADDSTVVIGSNSYVINYNDSTAGDNFGGGAYGNFVTLSITAIPEASSILLGGLVCIVVGSAVGGRKFLKRRAATTA